MSIKYEVVPNRLKEGTYYPRVVRGNRIPLERLIKDIVDATTVSETDTRAVLNALAQRVAVHLQDGHMPVLDGLVAFSVSLRETLESSDSHVTDAADLRVNVRVSPDLLRNVRHVARFERVYRQDRAPIVTALFDAHTGSENVYTAGNIARLRGADMKFDPVADDEGIFLVPASGGESIAVATYAQAGAREIVFLVPPRLAGEYYVEVRTRYGTNVLRTGRMKNTVKSPA